MSAASATPQPTPADIATRAYELAYVLRDLQVLAEGVMREFASNPTMSNPAPSQ